MKFDPLLLFPLFIGLAVGALVVWHFKKSNSFSIMDFVSTGGHADPQKASYTGAFLISTWGFWVMMEQGKMTEWYFTCYIGAFVIGGVWTASRRISARVEMNRKDRGISESDEPEK